MQSNMLLLIFPPELPPITDKEILESVVGSKAACPEEGTAEGDMDSTPAMEDQDPDDVEPQKVTINEPLACLQTARRYFEQQTDAAVELESLMVLLDSTLKHKLAQKHQSTISEFFKPL